MLSFLPLHAYGAQVLEAQAERHEGRFLIRMRIALDAAPVASFRALQDYAAMPRYNPDLRAVRVLGTDPPNRVRLLTTVHSCVLLFCKTVQQQQLMTATGTADGGSLQAELVPQAGAFAGSGHWAVGPCRTRQNTSCLNIEIVLVPNFWVPPLIGAWLIRRKMIDEARQTGRGLERVARGLDWP